MIDAIIDHFPLIGFLVLLTIHFVLSSAKKKKEVERGRQQKAVRVAKYFGNSTITLVHFPASSEHDEGVWALVGFDPSKDVISSIADYDKCFILSKYFGKDERSVEKGRREACDILNLLPYSIAEKEAHINFATYQAWVEKRHIREYNELQVL